MKYHLILASQSPRRKELIGFLEIPYEVLPSNAAEESQVKDPVGFSQEIALVKARSIVQKVGAKKNNEIGSVIVSADTIVVLEGEIFGKPDSKDDARIMLKKMSGKTHDVYTSVVITMDKREKIFTVKTSVTFDIILESLLEKYLDSGDSLDKAGAYGIQGEALNFISKVNGSYSNVVGFPLSDFTRELSLFLNLDLNSNDWRLSFC